MIIATFEKSGTRNLRILKHALADFKRIFDIITKAYPNTNNRVLQAMLIFTIAVSFEIKAGKITKDKLTNIKSNAMLAQVEALSNSTTKSGDEWTLRDLLALTGIGAQGIKFVCRS